MYSIGIDLGSSSIKVALVHSKTGTSVVVVSEPDKEMDIVALNPDWAEQDPTVWWRHTCVAIKRLIKESAIDATNIQTVGISYQMHGLVLVDIKGNPVRNSIIWCDSRAVAIGKEAYQQLGIDFCNEQLLNSPANFTASKLKWVKENEPDVYKSIYKFMLPGDFIAMKLTGKIQTTKNGLSEGVLWNIKKDRVALELLDHYGIDKSLVPDIIDNFIIQSQVNESGFKETGIPVGAVITYRSGDQPNNALSLNVMNSGEIAATGGTSGVLYAVSDNINPKEYVRINNFLHVNHTSATPSIGKLLCINGAGSQYRWLNHLGLNHTYEQMNALAQSIPVGADGLRILPFGNGAERVLSDANIGSHILNLNFNVHGAAHLYRAALEGIAFSFMYGMEILKKDQLEITVIRAGNDNLFRSDVFSITVATLIGNSIEIYNTTGAIGAARASNLINSNFTELGQNIIQNDYVKTYNPDSNTAPYFEAYECWKKQLNITLKNHL